MTEALQIRDPDEDALRTALRETRQRIDALVGDLRLVDDELDALERERQQVRLLGQVCESLEALDGLGGAHLFWDGGPDGGGADHLRLVRGRIDAFDKRVHEVEERRQGILDEIQREEDQADWIAGDVLEAEQRAEQREHEWAIEREVAVLPVRTSTMPWTRGGEDDQRFRRALAASLALALLLGLLLPLVDLPIPERWQVLEEQDRLTRLIPKEQVTPPPVAEVEPVPTMPEEAVPSEESESPIVAEAAEPQADPAPAARKDTASKGILAFREKFSSLASRDATARLGSNARIDDAGEVADGLPQRSMVTTQAPGSSGGINVAELSRGTGGTGERLAGVAVTRATSTIGAGGGSDRPLAGSGPSASRTDEEIQIVFDRHKAALYRLYNRALRKNPTLKGQIVLRLTIEPDGSVSLCEVKSSDMKAPALGERVVARVSTFDFGAKEGIPPVTIVYPIDFLPAT